MNRWREGFSALGRSVFLLTDAERRLVCVIIALALLGLGVRWWTRQKAGGPASSPQPPAPPAAQHHAAP